MSEAEYYTDPFLAKRIIEYFQPSGWFLDPCRGGGANGYLSFVYVPLVRLKHIRGRWQNIRRTWNAWVCVS
jgi:hypothetical protein